MRGIFPPLDLSLMLGTNLLWASPPQPRRGEGAVGAIVLAWSYGTLSCPCSIRAWRQRCAYRHGGFHSDRARVFSLVFQELAQIWIEDMLTALAGRTSCFLVLPISLCFLFRVLPRFLRDRVIIIPLLTPAADKLGIDLIWFGVL